MARNDASNEKIIKSKLVIRQLPKFGGYLDVPYPILNKRIGIKNG